MVNFLHVGDYKTGTSWMQRFAYPLHPEINYLGGPFKDQNFEKVLNELIDARDLDFDKERIKNKLLVLISQTEIEKITGISREVFSCTNHITGENARRNAERLFNVFGPVKIIFTIREQLSMIYSIYSQYIKMGGTLPINSFIYDPIVSKGLIERLKWHKQIKMYYEIFGKKNVYIGLYEQFKYDKNSFLKNIYKFLGCRNINFMLKTEEIVNKRLTNLGVFFSRYCNKFFRSHYNNSDKLFNMAGIMKFIIKKRKIKAMQEGTERIIFPNYGELDLSDRTAYALNWKGVSLVRRISEKISLGTSFYLPEEKATKISSHFIKSNNILEAKYGLPVRKYGYRTE